MLYMVEFQGGNQVDGQVYKVLGEVYRDEARPVLVTRFGSHLYGTNTPKSDRDWYIVFVPSPYRVLDGTAKSSYRYTSGPSNEKNSPGDVDVQAVDLRDVLRRFQSGETNAIDLIFAPTNQDAAVYVNYEVWSMVWGAIMPAATPRLFPVSLKGVLGYVDGQVNKYGVRGTRLGDMHKLRDMLAEAMSEMVHATVHEFVTKVILDKNVFLSDAISVVPYHVADDSPPQFGLEVQRKQIMAGEKLSSALNKVNRWIEKYGARVEQAKRDQGVDWKAVSHALRALFQLEQLLTKGFVTFPLPRDVRGYLRAVKDGRMRFTDTEEVIATMLDRVRSLAFKPGDEDAYRAVIRRLYEADFDFEYLDEYQADQVAFYMRMLDHFRGRSRR